MTKFNIKDIQYEIASPCNEKWEQMKKINNSCRHCSQCENLVYDIKEMSEDDVQQLFSTNPNHLSFCLKVYQRTDGRVLLKDCSFDFKDAKNYAIKGKLKVAVFIILLLLTPIAFFKDKLISKLVSMVDTTYGGVGYRDRE